MENSEAKDKDKKQVDLVTSNLNKKRDILIKAIIAVAILFSICLIIYPFWGNIKYYFNKLFNQNTFDESIYIPNTTSEVDPLTLGVKVEDYTIDKVIIPSIGVDIELFDDGNPAEQLNKGAFLVPGSALPGEKGEGLITGHRFNILPPAKNTFYNLDKVKKGEDFILIKDGYAYRYRVFDIKVVEGPDNYEFAGKNDEYTENQMILFTCTPLWSAKNRLLVIGKQVKY